MGLKVFRDTFNEDDESEDIIFVQEIESSCFEIINAYKPNHCSSMIPVDSTVVLLIWLVGVFAILNHIVAELLGCIIPDELWTLIFSRIMLLNRQQVRHHLIPKSEANMRPKFQFDQLTTVCKLWLKLVYAGMTDSSSLLHHQILRFYFPGPLQESLINFQVYSDLVLVYYTSLTELNLGSNTRITDSGIRNLTNIVNLSLRCVDVRFFFDVVNFIFAFVFVLLFFVHLIQSDGLDTTERSPMLA
jgi:hypothetical protein